MPRNNKKNKGAEGQQGSPAAAVESPAAAADAAPQQQGKKEGGGGGKRNDACCVFVGNVAFTTTWQKLKDVMRKAGDVDLVELVVDSSHKPKGSALVSFKNEEDAKTAIATLNGVVVDGREILVRSYEKGARPLVIYGNYTREQLNRVIPKGSPQGQQGQPGQQQQGHQPQQQQNGGHQPPHHQHQHQQQHQQGGHHHQQQQHMSTGGDRVNLRPQGGGKGGQQEWRVHDGGDFNRRNRDTFGDDAVSYRPAQGNGMPSASVAAAPPQPASMRQQQQQGGFSQAQHGAERKKLFVSNLPFTCSWKLLKDTFSQVGKVLRADIIMDDRGRSRGMGTVVFATQAEAEKAIEEFDGIEMDGRPMGVRLDRDFLGPHH